MFQACFGAFSSDNHTSRDVFYDGVNDNNSSTLKLMDDRVLAAGPSLSSSNRSTDLRAWANVLLEIVGATALQDISQNIDTFCIVKVNGKEVHRTKTIPNDFQPIFTCKTKALCLLKRLHEHDTVVVQLCRPNTIVPGATAISLFSVIGAVTLAYDKLVNGEGKRREFNICKDDKMIVLSLRFREATPGDLLYFATEKELDVASYGDAAQRGLPSPSSTKDHASDIDFKNVSKKSILQQQQKTIKVEDGEELAFRVFPGPDPIDPQNTTFMTAKQMERFLHEPSRDWVEAGWGDFGAVYIEILGCDNLPQMDTEMIDGFTDPFAGIVFEDTFVRSSVIFDNLNPRWPPWSQRAIKFNIGHPSSVIYVGIFDFDENYLDDNDPIGRVALHLDSFEPDTLYTLKYALSNADIPRETDRGTITIRLEVRWKKSLMEVSRAQSYLRPPRFIINTKTERSWKIIRYLTRGSVDMADVTIDSCKLFANELVDHWKEYCYLFDIVFSIFLWRGTYEFLFFGKNISFWFPLDSLYIFASVSLALEYPVYFPSIVLYSFAFALLRKNYFLSTNPSPWLCKKSARKICMTNLGFKPRPTTIRPGMGENDARALARIEEYRMYRVTGFLYESLKIALQVYRVYSKTSPVDISTVAKSGSLVSKLYVNYLTYLHMMLKYMCKYIRVIKNFATWQSTDTYRFTAHCLVFATFWLCFPYKHYCFWLVRAVVWLLLGPWMKLVDVAYIRKFYRTREDTIRDGVPQTVEEMKNDIASRPNILEPLLHAKLLETMANAGRVVLEKNVKLRDFRETYFGKYSESIPLVDASRYPSVPLPTSFAHPRDDGKNEKETINAVPSESIRWTYVAGQKLHGTMIPQQRI